MKHIHLQSTDSTNNYLKNYVPEQEEDITLVTADFQTAGRGQRGNSWESEDGKNVVYSLLIHPRMVKPSQIFSISEVAALSVCKALNECLLTASASREQTGESLKEGGFKVKWPNDIYFADKKIAGILIETDLMGKSIENAIIGVGINVNQQRFLSDAPNPVSLYQIVGQEFERTAVLNLIIKHFTALYAQLQEGGLAELHEHFKSRLYRRDGFYPYSDENGRFDAQIVDIEPTGHIILQDTAGQQRRYAFKEVTFLIKG